MRVSGCMIEGVSELPKGAGAKALAGRLAPLYRPASSLSAFITAHEGVPHRAPNALMTHIDAQRPANRRQFAGCERDAQLACPFNYGNQRQPSGRRARFHFQYRHRMHRMFSAFRYKRSVLFMCRYSPQNLIRLPRGCPRGCVCVCGVRCCNTPKGVIAAFGVLCTNRVIALLHKVTYPPCLFIKSGVRVIAQASIHPPFARLSRFPQLLSAAGNKSACQCPAGRQRQSRSHCSVPWPVTA